MNYKVTLIDHSYYQEETYYSSRKEALDYAKAEWDNGEGGYKYVEVVKLTATDSTCIYQRDYDKGPQSYPEDLK